MASYHYSVEFMVAQLISCFFFHDLCSHLQVSLCTPNENTPTESLARLVSMVFQWFHSTAYMMDDEVGSLVEKLKPQFVTKWLKTVCEVRFDVMVMCLLPKPVEFARVSSRLSGQILEGGEITFVCL